MSNGEPKPTQPEFRVEELEAGGRTYHRVYIVNKSVRLEIATFDDQDQAAVLALTLQTIVDSFLKFRVR